MPDHFVHKLYENTSADGLQYICFSDQKVAYNFRGRSSLFLYLKVVLITEGEAEWQIDDTLTHVERGDIIILNNRERRYLASVPLKTGMRMEFFTFSPLTVYPHTKLLSVFMSREKAFPRKLPRTDGYTELLDIFRDVREECEADRYLKDETIYGKLVLLLAKIARICSTCGCGGNGHQGNTIPLGYYQNISRTLVFINDHYSERLSEATVAQASGMPLSSFSRLFSSFLGISFSEYLRRFRLQKTIELLTWKTGQNILSAAMDCGFGSSSGFYKAVKELTGSTPSELVRYQ